MRETSKIHAGLDVHKDSISVAIAEPGRIMLSEQLDSWERDMASKALLLGKLEGMQLGEQRGMQLGVQQGKLEGLLEGKFEAQSYTLRRLLSRRFGVLSSGVSAQIAAADISQIETWLDRVLDASSVAEVLRNH